MPTYSFTTAGSLPGSGLRATYFSPTTPGAASFTVDVTGHIRLGSITGLAQEAEMGAVGNGNVVFDDTDGTFGHLSDGIVGLKQMYFDETNCPSGNQRLWTGYIGDRRYHRGQNDSLITGVARKIDVTLVDVNDFLGFRVFAPTALDPTSDFNRPAETDVARIAALLTTVDFLTDTLFDDGYINTVGPVALDANDYTGSRPVDVLNDAAQMSGKNFFVFFNETTHRYALWYDFVSSDGSNTKVYDSALRLTNVLSEHDGVTTFAIAPDAVGVLDPSRVISAIYVNGTGVTAYRTLASTANTFAWRDSSPITSSVKTLAKANALGDRDLAENSTEDNRISCTVQVPNTLVTGIKQGQRIQAHFTHIPGVQSTFTWCRILQMTIRQDVETTQYYWLDLEITPVAAAAIVQAYTWTEDLGCFASQWPAAPGTGNMMISGCATRGNVAVYTGSNVPISNTGTPGATCDATKDIGGTAWSLVTGSSLVVAPAPGSPTFDNPGDLVTLAYKVAAGGESQINRWRTSDRARTHYAEIAGLSGAPTVTSFLNGYQSADNVTFVSPALATPAAGYWIFLYASNLTGPSDGPYPNSSMTATAPAVIFTDGHYGGLTRGWTVGAVGFHPYSVFGYLKTSGAGTDHVTLIRTAGSGWIHDGAAWTCAFWPS